MSKLSAPLTCLTAGSLGIAYAGLQLRVGLHRLNSGIKFGTKVQDGKADDEALMAKMRAGANMQVSVHAAILRSSYQIARVTLCPLC
jgi:hypothetical protein